MTFGLNKMLIMLRLWTGAVALLLAFTACDDGKVNFFSVDQDKQFGEEVFAQLSADPGTYPILPRLGNEDLYERVEAIRDEILASGELRHAETFDWEIRSEEHTSELQSRPHLVCRLLLEKKKEARSLERG